ncbi:hypothetical protein FSARC_2210 [Fusarium sarcochroum]|uniref:Fido domain-containing protein n=1 Tax=Fusarium sarcochroum TaxID=1208366 RepID=A0A8H4U7B4_9HYPO|nr:hypothetical protein FSARC_2210 [Fusarium sarcochroum]
MRLRLSQFIHPSSLDMVWSRHAPETTMDHSAYDYDILGDGADPDELHFELFQRISAAMPWKDMLDDYYIEKLSRMVYGSNMIENAGGDLDTTLDICQQIFEGKQVKGYDSFIKRGHREIIQHAKATYYIFDQIIKGKDLSEEMILKTHRILTAGIDTEDGIPWAEYSGTYRQHPVRAGLHPFMHEHMVPSAMRQMINSYTADVLAAKEKEKIDPVALAAKYCHIFVNIHPFADGNGRICRLILNAILFKYARCIVSFGEDEEDRELYLHIAADSSLQEVSVNQEDLEDLPDEFKPKCYKKLASFTLKHALDGMREILNLEWEG